MPFDLLRLQIVESRYFLFADVLHVSQSLIRVVHYFRLVAQGIVPLHSFSLLNLLDPFSDPLIIVRRVLFAFPLFLVCISSLSFLSFVVPSLLGLSV